MRAPSSLRTAIVAGLFLGALVLAVSIRFLPNLLVVNNQPNPADAVIVLGGDSDGSRLRKGVTLFETGVAPRLILTGGKKQKWLAKAQKFCPECRLEERAVVYLLGSIDTRTDAQLTLAYSRDQQLDKLLVITSPYHTRRTQFVFNDICGESGIDVTVVSSGDYGRLLSPDAHWWRDPYTVKTAFTELAKILYWELTPFEDLSPLNIVRNW